MHTGRASTTPASEDVGRMYGLRWITGGQGSYSTQFAASYYLMGYP